MRFLEKLILVLSTVLYFMAVVGVIASPLLWPTVEVIKVIIIGIVSSIMNLMISHFLISMVRGSIDRDDLNNSISKIIKKDEN